jgi:NADP-dependent 3-hydroxy acid dehydrogenase YdfG
MSRSAHTSRPRTNRFAQTVGWALVAGSFPVWFALFAAPFLPLPATQRVLAAVSLAAAGEIMFWLGGALLGASVVRRFRKPNVRTGRSFADNSVAVVGATGGLGGAVVDALLREGATTLAIGRDSARLEELRAGRNNLKTAVADVCSEESLAAAATATSELDALVIATGTDVRKSLSAHSESDIRSQLDTNLAGAVFTVRAFADRMREGGTIVILGGFGDGRLALPYYSVDVASRAGVSAFAQAMNREFALEGRDLRVCYACPAPADTAAERPFADLWRKMGTPVVSPERVADFVLTTTLQRKPIAVMGWQNTFITCINTVSPWLANVFGLDSASRHLRDAFGTPHANPASWQEEPR